MKNYELLDMIGEAGEDYVLAAEDGKTRSRFRWRGWVAAAACAALLVGVYPASQAFLRRQANSAPEQKKEAAGAGALIDSPGLHSYLLIEEGVQIAATQDERKAPARDGGADVSGQSAPAPDPAQMAPAYGGNAGILAGSQQGGGAETGDDTSRDGDAPAQEGASGQYRELLQWMGGQDGREPDVYPDWFAGAWIDGDRLTVAIVDSFRTPGLEAQVTERCGGTEEVRFTGAKYAQNHLNGLMDGVARILEEQDVRISSAYGVCVMDNCLGLDFFGAAPGDEVLAALAGLDPEGDAIRIQVFCDRRLQPTDEKGPAPGETAQPTSFDPPQDNAAPIPTPVPGGAQGVDELPQAKGEEYQPAQYDLLPLE